MQSKFLVVVGLLKLEWANILNTYVTLPLIFLYLCYNCAIYSIIALFLSMPYLVVLKMSLRILVYDKRSELCLKTHGCSGKEVPCVLFLITIFTTRGIQKNTTLYYNVNYLYN